MRSTGARYRPKSFAARFRTAVRKFLYYQKRISKLGPGYFNCNERQSSCTRRSAQPRKGCPTCEYTIQTKIFHKELDDELRKVKGGTRQVARKWPREQLLKLAVEAGSLASIRKTNDPEWPILLSLMVSIYRDEAAKLRAIETFNITSGSNEEPASYAVPKDLQQTEDEGDFD